MNQTELDYKIQQAEKELAKLKAEKEQYDSMGQDQLLAIELHDTMCRHNHTDGCGWFYEISSGQHRWESREHTVWLQKATNLLRSYSMETVLDIAKRLGY